MLKRRRTCTPGCFEPSVQGLLPSDSLQDLAVQLLDTYELRAADSLQLAAALTWCQYRPSRRAFLSADQRLSKCAAADGFSVIALS